MNFPRVWQTGAAAALVGLFGWAEWKTWRASRDLVVDTPRGRVGVLVLGCPQSVVDRWRVRIAVRSVDPQRALFVFSGAAVHTPISEAKMMADYAVGVLGVPPANVVIEDRSTTTVENVVNSAEVLADCAVVMVASNTLHAQRARRIMHDENPQLASRLVQARDYIPFEWGPLHLLLIVFEWYREWRVRKRNATS